MTQKSPLADADNADNIIEISALSDGAAIDASPVPTSITVHQSSDDW